MTIAVADPLEIPAFLRRTRTDEAPRSAGRMSLVGVKLGSAPLPPADPHERICEACARRRGPFLVRRPLRISWRAQLELPFGGM